MRYLPVACALWAASPAAAQKLEDYDLKGDPYTIMRDLGRCSAVWDVGAELYTELNEPAQAEEARGYSRGWWAAASFFALTIPHQTPEQQQNTLTGIIETERTRQRAFIERGEHDAKLMAICKTLQPLQEVMIEDLRRQGYLSGRKLGE